jgi:acetyl-CoA carboxylase biotin carboxylase subunit
MRVVHTEAALLSAAADPQRGAGGFRQPMPHENSCRRRATSRSVLADEHKNACTSRARLLMQRRHQKIIEEAPAPGSARLASASAAPMPVARSVIAAPARSSYSSGRRVLFIEMNTACN